MAPKGTGLAECTTENEATLTNVTRDEHCHRTAVRCCRNEEDERKREEGEG